MLARRFLLAGSAILALGACAKDEATRVTAPSDVAAFKKDKGPDGFRTSQPAQAEVLVPGGKLVPILTTGDLLPGTTVPWGPVPDGLGAYQSRGGFTVFSNHEITAGGVTSTNGGAPILFSRVSKLSLNEDLEVTGGEYPEDGSGGYIRFCSATWADGVAGLPTGYFLTGEENGATGKGAVQLAISGSGQKYELPHLGAYSHENQIAVPGFDGVVTLGFDDSQGQSELYLYWAKNERAFISGDQSKGGLYVFKTDKKSAAGNPLHSGNLSEGETIKGYFARIDDPADLGAAPADRYNRLQNKVDAVGGMPFVRLEDGDFVKDGWHDADDPTAYFVDTGALPVTGRAQVGADCGGPCDAYGSIYKIVLNKRDPTKGAELTLVARSHGVADQWASPDNIALSSKAFMLQEDPAHADWNQVRVPGIWSAKLLPHGRLSAFEEVVQVTQETLLPATGKCIEPAGTCWETSGIISTEDILGPGTWLFNVQAHNLPFTIGTGASALQYRNESGQLLYLKLPGT